MLIGKRVRLRAIERDDIPRFVEWLNDPEVVQGLSFYVPMSRDMEEGWFDALKAQKAEERPLGIEILTEEGWALIGNMSLMGINWVNREAEVGIFIGEKAYWSQGYGRDAMVMMLRYAFRTLGLNRVWLRVFETNRRAVRSYEKAGFVHEGCMRQAQYQDGCFIDVLLMSALRSEWQDPESITE